jgi:hypothetical protein
MAATLADSITLDTPVAKASVSATTPAAAQTVARAPGFHESPAGIELHARTEAGRMAALADAPDYHIKDINNMWNSAINHGKERGHFDVANVGRDTDADWKHGRNVGNFTEASSQHAEELAMNVNSSRSYAAAKEAGRGSQWLEAYNLGREQVVRRAEFEGALEAAQAGAKVLAKDAVGLMTEGPVGEAMALRDMAKLAASAPSIGQLLAGGAAVGATTALGVAVAKDYLDTFEKKAEQLHLPVHQAREAIASASNAFQNYHGAQGLIDAGDHVIDKATNAASQALSPVTQPVEQAKAHVAKAAEHYTAPATHAIGDALKPVGDAVNRAWDAVLEVRDHLQEKAFQAVYGKLLAEANHGSGPLSREEARAVVEELSHVKKGDVLVVEGNGNMHMVPAGAKMPDFPQGTMHLDADALREAAGINRAAPERAQQVAQAAPAHTAALER